MRYVIQSFYSFEHRRVTCQKLVECPTPEDVYAATTLAMMTQTEEESGYMTALEVSPNIPFAADR